MKTSPGLRHLIARSPIKCANFSDNPYWALSLLYLPQDWLRVSDGDKPESIQRRDLNGIIDNEKYMYTTKPIIDPAYIHLLMPSPVAASAVTDTFEHLHVRDYLVIRLFEKPMNEMIASVDRLARKGNLVMVVISADDETIEAWFSCRGIPERDLLLFFHHALRMGADPNTWDRSEWVFLPNGVDPGLFCRHEVVYAQLPQLAVPFTD